MKKQIITTLVSAICCGSVVAAPSMEPKDPNSKSTFQSGSDGSSTSSRSEDAKAMTGLVLGAQAGAGWAFDTDDFDNGGFNFGGFVGYDFAVSDYLSIGPEVNVNYTDEVISGSIPGISATTSVSTLNVPLLMTAKFMTPVGINLFAKGGIYYQYSEVDTNASTPIGTFSESDSYNNWNGAMALGGGYQIDNINIFAQWMWLWGSDVSDWSGNSALAQSIVTGGISLTLPH